MLESTAGYNIKMIEAMKIGDKRVEEITEQLGEYLSPYKSCFENRSQEKYFRVFLRGLLSDLDQKTIEPIVLSFLREKAGVPAVFPALNLAR